jgi:hypothetical protein
LPVVWSKPQSSQKRQLPVRGVPQFGHGVPEPGDRAGVVGSGGETGWLVAGALVAGVLAGGALTDRALTDRALAGRALAGGALVAGALAGGGLSTIVPPIFAPQWSQKSSVDEAWPFGQG